MNSTRSDDGNGVDARLRERLLLASASGSRAQSIAGDRLMLADTTLLAALDGSRALTPNERRALQQSPLTLRRLRHLARDRRILARVPAVNDASWTGSAGMLRAASGGAVLERLVTDDGYWQLHFLSGAAAGVDAGFDAGAGTWQVILALAPEAPFAARLLREQPLLRVVDGGGAIVLQGRLDGDGECERAWPFDMAPGSHFQLYGASFAVEPLLP
jgi:hypothetical protein